MAGGGLMALGAILAIAGFVVASASVPSHIEYRTVNEQTCDQYVPGTNICLHYTTTQRQESFTVPGSGVPGFGEVLIGIGALLFIIGLAIAIVGVGRKSRQAYQEGRREHFIERKGWITDDEIRRMESQTPKKSQDAEGPTMICRKCGRKDYYAFCPIDGSPMEPR